MVAGVAGSRGSIEMELRFKRDCGFAGYWRSREPVREDVSVKERCRDTL